MSRRRLGHGDTLVPSPWQATHSGGFSSLRFPPARCGHGWSRWSRRRREARPQWPSPGSASCGIRLTTRRRSR